MPQNFFRLFLFKLGKQRIKTDGSDTVREFGLRRAYLCGYPRKIYRPFGICTVVAAYSRDESLPPVVVCFPERGVT